MMSCAGKKVNEKEKRGFEPRECRANIADFVVK